MTYLAQHFMAHTPQLQVASCKRWTNYGTLLLVGGGYLIDHFLRRFGQIG